MEGSLHASFRRSSKHSVTTHRTQWRTTTGAMGSILSHHSRRSRLRLDHGHQDEHDEQQDHDRQIETNTTQRNGWNEPAQKFDGRIRHSEDRLEDDHHETRRVPIARKVTDELDDDSSDQ